jgi:hypothetical protein
MKKFFQKKRKSNLGNFLFKNSFENDEENEKINKYIMTTSNSEINVNSQYTNEIKFSNGMVNICGVWFKIKNYKEK